MFTTASAQSTHGFSLPIVRETPLPPADPSGDGGW